MHTWQWEEAFREPLFEVYNRHTSMPRCSAASYCMSLLFIMYNFSRCCWCQFGGGKHTSMARSCVASYCERRYSMKGRCAASGGQARCTYAASAAASAASASRSGASRDSSSCAGKHERDSGSNLHVSARLPIPTVLRPASYAGSWIQLCCAVLQDRRVCRLLQDNLVSYF